MTLALNNGVFAFLHSTFMRNEIIQNEVRTEAFNMQINNSFFVINTKIVFILGVLHETYPQLIRRFHRFDATEGGRSESSRGKNFENFSNLRSGLFKSVFPCKRHFIAL